MIAQGSGAAFSLTIPVGRWSLINKGSRLAVDVAEASTDNRAKAEHWGYNGGDWQKFDLTCQLRGIDA